VLFSTFAFSSATNLVTLPKVLVGRLVWAPGLRKPCNLVIYRASAAAVHTNREWLTARFVDDISVLSPVRFGFDRGNRLTENLRPGNERVRVIEGADPLPEPFCQAATEGLSPTWGYALL
jgi:hypothetical protein